MTNVAVLLLWLASGYRLFMLSKSLGFINCSYAVAASGIAAAFTVKALEAPVDALTGPYVSDLLEHLLVVGAGVAAQLFLLALRTGAPPRRAVATRTAIAAAVAVVMVATFVAAPVHQPPSTADFDQVYGQLGIVAIYRLVFNAHLTFVLLDNVRLCRRYARIHGDLGIAISLRLVGWGSAIALAYSVSRFLYIVVDLIVGSAPAAIHKIGSEAAAVGLCGLAVGMLAPRVVPGLSTWLDVRQDTRRLGPLWADLTAVFPSVRLVTGRGVGPRRSALRHDRRLLEVAEGLDKARLPYLMLPGAATTEARTLQVLAAELHEHQTAWTQSGGTPARRFLPAVADRTEERRLLLKLADAYAVAPETRGAAYISFGGQV